MKFADQFDGKGKKKEKILPSSVKEEKWLEKSRKYLENLNISQDTQSQEEVDREVVADTHRYPPPSVARGAAPPPPVAQPYASSAGEPSTTAEDVNGFVDLDQIHAAPPPEAMTWSLHEAAPELQKTSRNPRVRAAKNLMQGLGKLLDDESKRESTVVRVDADGGAAGRDRTMTPAVGERGRSRTVTVIRNGQPYQELEFGDDDYDEFPESPYAVEASMKKKRRQIAEELLDR